MLKLKNLFKSSYMEMKNVRGITLTAMLGAVSIVLGSYFTIMLWDFLKVGFSFLPNEFVYYLFGPFVGIVYGAAIDILTFLVRPMGAYFPGFTISSMLTGLIYGMILYRKPISIKRVAAANTIRMVFVDLLLNTYWLTLLYGYSFFAIVPVRALKQLIMLPFETFLLYILIKGVEASGVLRALHGRYGGIKVK